MRILLTILFFAIQISGWWTVQSTGWNTNLRGVSVIQNSSTKRFVIWASGSNGFVLRSTDDGNTWQQLKVDGAAALDFRDVEAFDDNVAYLMSSGEIEQSRIYKTIRSEEH